MGYAIAVLGLIFLISGITGKVLPLKRPSLIEVPPQMNRIIYGWLGLLFTGVGVFLIVEGHKN
jgi:threonine/homoserine/homoserine lactone efflux protein